MKIAGIAALVLMMCAWPLAAGASQCPMLGAQIDKALGQRFDKTASNARNMAAQAAGLHKAGKHAESEKMYQEAAKAGGVKLEMK